MAAPVRIVAVLALGLTCGMAWAQYPARAIRLLLPNPPGGAIDTVGRIVAPRLASRLGQPVVVENRPGSNGTIAVEAAARAAPDGHTLLLAADAQIVINPHLYPKANVDPRHDLTPVATVATTRMVLVVHPQVAATSLDEFIALARRSFPPLAYASIGTGSQHHLMMELLRMRAGIDLLHVPYKGGGPAMTALLAGEVVAMMGGNSATTQARSGKVRAIATVGRARTPGWPDLPTLHERYPGVEATTWIAIFGPARLPEIIADRLRTVILGALDDADVRARFDSVGGMEPLPGGPDDLAALIRSDDTKYGAIIRDARITVD